MERVTIKDIAKESGVSTASVSRVLNNIGNTTEKTQEKVMKAVEKLNYQPNAVARSLKWQRTNIIGIILPDIANSYFMKISKGIEAVIGDNEYTLLFAFKSKTISTINNAIKTVNIPRRNFPFSLRHISNAIFSLLPNFILLTPQVL